MQVSRVRKILNRRWWITVTIFSLFGFFATMLIYLVGLSSRGFNWESFHSGLLMAACPPIIMTMAISHSSRKEVLEIYGMISAINAVLFLIVGLFFATVFEALWIRAYKVGRADGQGMQ